MCIYLNERDVAIKSYGLIKMLFMPDITDNFQGNTLPQKII
jgi:hypothetical protein